MPVVMPVVMRAERAKKRQSDSEPRANSRLFFIFLALVLVSVTTICVFSVHVSPRLKNPKESKRMPAQALTVEQEPDERVLIDGFIEKNATPDGSGVREPDQRAVVDTTIEDDGVTEDLVTREPGHQATVDTVFEKNAIAADTGAREPDQQTTLDGAIEESALAENSGTTQPDQQATVETAVEENANANSQGGDHIPDASDSTVIPRVIHQSWKTSDHIPSRFLPWMRSWTDAHPEWTYVFWTDDDNLALFEHVYPQYLSVARVVNKISLADMARYALLHNVGGLYVDVDFECKKPFNELHRTHRVFLGTEPLAHSVLLEKSTEPLLCNAIMASVPQHPFWLSVLDNIKSGFDRATNKYDAVGLTGPRVVKQTYFGNAAYSTDPTLTVLPPEYFYPEVAYWNTGELNKACRQRKSDPVAQESCAWLEMFPEGQFTANTHATHHWQCTWCREEQSPEYSDLDAIFEPASSPRAGRVFRPKITAAGVTFVRAF